MPPQPSPVDKTQTAAAVEPDKIVVDCQAATTYKAGDENEEDAMDANTPAPIALSHGMTAVIGADADTYVIQDDDGGFVMRLPRSLTEAQMKAICADISRLQQRMIRIGRDALGGELRALLGAAGAAELDRRFGDLETPVAP